MNKNFNHLMMLYERMYNMGLQIKQMINEGNMQELDNIVKNKSDLIEKILRFEKTFEGTEQEKQQQKQMRTKIEELEKENIGFLQKQQQILQKELNTVSRGKKITRAYLSAVPEINSTIDITE